MHAGQFSDAVGFSGCDLLVSETGAGHGLRDDEASGIGGDIRVADHEAQGATLQVALLTYLVDLRNVSTREFDHGSSPPARGIWLNKNSDSQRLSFCERLFQT